MCRMQIELDTMHEAAGEAARLLKTLANRDRLMLLCRLSQGEASPWSRPGAKASTSSTASRARARLPC
jgi:ArsR family transcriptional regulator